jgi:hypothetical protein
MLKLQREYHCYNSARLEAAVEALEKGWGIGAVQMREFVLSFFGRVVDADYSVASRLCLDLLNEQLRERMRAWGEY